MREVKLGQGANVMLFVSTTDHLTPKTGAILSVSLSKNGGAFSPIAPIVTERGYGWYAVALISAHTDTEGDLIVRAVAADADPAERCLVVYSTKAADAVRVGGAIQSPGDLAALVADVASEDNLNAVGALVADTATSAALALVAEAVAAKASQTSIDAVSTAVATRASQTSVDSIAAAIPDLATEANVNAVGALVADTATAEQVAAMAVILSFLEDLARGETRWVYDKQLKVTWLITKSPSDGSIILKKQLMTVDSGGNDKVLPPPLGNSLLTELKDIARV